MRDKRGISLGDAPTVILIVGFIFLLMVTVSYVMQEYQDAMPDTTYTVTNETLTTVDEVGEKVANNVQCGFSGFSVTSAYNGSVLLTAANYTADSDGTFRYNTGLGDAAVNNNSNINLTYTYTHKGTACNVTKDGTAEITDNTSIAGIILTISLVGIVLSVLIGIFVLARRGRGV